MSSTPMSPSLLLPYNVVFHYFSKLKLQLNGFGLNHFLTVTFSQQIKNYIFLKSRKHKSLQHQSVSSTITTLKHIAHPPAEYDNKNKTMCNLA